MPDFLSSDTFVSEETPQVPQITGQPTARTGAVGTARRGPVGEAVLSTSFEEFRDVFGGDDADSDLCKAARGFFRNGGKELYAARVVHYSDPSVASSKTSAAASLDLETPSGGDVAGQVLNSIDGPYDLTPGDTLLISVDGGGDQTVTWDAASAARESAAEPYDLANNETLTVRIDGGSVQTITFTTSMFANIDAATAEEVAAAINGQLVDARATVTSGGTKVTITSDKKGTSSGVNVTGGTANAALTFTTGNTTGTGDVADIDAVTPAEVASRINADTTGCVASVEGSKVRITSDTTGGSSSIQVKVSSTADDELGYDNATHLGHEGDPASTLTVDARYDGEYGNDITIKIAAPTNGEEDCFKLSVLEGGLTVEIFDNLSMDEDSLRYVETILSGEANQSKLITVTDLELAGYEIADRVPDTGTFGPLTGGDDGLTSLADADYIGDADAATGLHALDTTTDIRLLIVPGRATSAVHNEMIQYCEVQREGTCFAILDPPSGLSYQQIVTYVNETAQLVQLSEFAMIYWPLGKILNPNKSVFGNTDQVTVHVSGHIAGACARVDGSVPGGVHKAVAGRVNGRLVDVVDVENQQANDKKKRDFVEPKNINTLRAGKGIRPYINNSNCLKTNGNWGTIGERRGMIFIETAIAESMEFVRQQNLEDALYQETNRRITEFLRGETSVGAFASRDPKKAFYVDTGLGLNTDAVRKQKKLLAKIGVAKAKPAQFVSLIFSETTNAIDDAAAVS